MPSKRSRNNRIRAELLPFGETKKFQWTPNPSLAAELVQFNRSPYPGVASLIRAALHDCGYIGYERPRSPLVDWELGKPITVTLYKEHMVELKTKCALENTKPQQLAERCVLSYIPKWEELYKTLS